jgi:lipopolysaccharide/colanic/teichoic acid biosynthesis glycosyltransferase
MSLESNPYPQSLAVQDRLRGSAGQAGSAYLVAKRGFDIAATLMTAPVVLVVVGILALLIWCLDRQGAFFCQRRLGKDGRQFNLWKLQTMVPNADQRLQSYLETDPVAKDEWDRTQKLANDPRITRMGRFLRKYSLDELPQLLNVLRGDMSLVGPRPMMPQQFQSYPGTAYLRLRPGLTGLWQIGARNQSTFAERAIYDSRYANTMSFGTDLWILMRTPAVVFKGTGL